MKQEIVTIRSNEPLTELVWKMVVEADTSAITAPGQFVNLQIDGLYLRRPISICDWDENSITLIYKIVGEGTEKMSKMLPGTKLDVLVGLGNGYNTAKSGDAPLLIGGGVGIPPMYGLCKKLLAEGKKATVILGFNTDAEIFYEKEFADLGATVLVTTVDGSHGIKGFVTNAMEQVDYSYFYTCGPLPMFRAIDNAAKTSGQFSFEERMGCSCKTKYGNKRICKDGPVLEKEEIIW